MTHKPFGNGKHGLYHFFIRFFVATFATHIVLAYGEPYSHLELLVQRDYWEAFWGSFLIALLLIEVVYRVSRLIEGRIPKDHTLFNYAVLQIVLGIIPVSFLAFVFAAIYFLLRGRYILEEDYIRYDFPYIVSLIIILNLLYFFYFNFMRWTKVEHVPVVIPAQVAQETIIERYFEISKELKIPENDVLYFVHSGNCTKVFLVDLESPLICYHSLNKIERQIDAAQFFRINRTMIISRAAILEKRDHERRSQLTIKSKITPVVLVSQLHTPAFRKWFTKHNSEV